METSTIGSGRPRRDGTAAGRGVAGGGRSGRPTLAAPRTETEPKVARPGPPQPRSASSRRAAGGPAAAARPATAARPAAARRPAAVKPRRAWSATVLRGRPAAGERAGTTRRPSAAGPGAAARTGTGARTGTLRISAAARARETAVPRAPFILLVLCLLGGGLVCLLVINTTLGATSFEIDKLQHSANARILQEQALQLQISGDESPAKIAREACLLGLRPQQQLQYLDLRTRRVVDQPAGVAVQAPQAGCAR
jgi:hypothetical protein